MSEHKLQVAVAKLLDASGLLWTAIPNGGNRNVVTGAMLKAEGVKRGVPDIAIFTPFHQFTFAAPDILKHCLFIELKDGPKGKVSDHQKDWIRRLSENGYRAEVCRSLDEVLTLLRECYPHKFP